MANRISVNMSVKDVFNAKRASQTVEAVIGKPIKVSGFAVSETVDAETGEVKEVGYIVEKDTGAVFGFVSDICREALDDLNELVTEDPAMLKDLTIVFKKNKSKNGREFYYIQIL